MCERTRPAIRRPCFVFFLSKRKTETGKMKCNSINRIFDYIQSKQQILDAFSLSHALALKQKQFFFANPFTQSSSSSITSVFSHLHGSQSVCTTKLSQSKTHRFQDEQLYRKIHRVFKLQIFKECCGRILFTVCLLVFFALN